MSEHREATRQHYDLHAQQQQHLPTSLALKARREGPAAPLKKFHNDIKRRLIYRFAYQVEALIDYACGRGGDLHKWKAAMVRYVKGLDISGAEIAEAERRLGELLAADCQLQVEFQQTDRLGQEPHEEPRQFDVATCMFAIHYFFDKAETLKTLLATIASNLKPGGYFIGCVPDGKRVKAHLQKNDGKLVQQHLVLKTVTGDFNSFGSSYIMEIPDTVVEGHEGLTEGSHEYLVFDKVLLAEAAKAGLYPVKDLGDEELDQLFEAGDKDKAMKHFKPQYPATTHDSLKTASQLYMAFVLQKAASAADVSVPVLPPRERVGGGGGGGGGDRSAAGRGGARPQQRGGNKMSSLEWTLPYPAVSLPQKDLPSVYVNVRHDGLQKRAHALRRWIIYPPPLPEWSGPVQYVPDVHGNPTQPIPQRLPNGAASWEYLTELNYHRDMQAQQAGYPMPPQQQPPHHQQQHQGPGGRPAYGQQQQQQQHGQPPAASDPQHPGNGPPDTSRGRGGGRGTRGRGRGSKAAAAAAAAGDGAQDAAGIGRGGGRGRGRGSRGGRAAGSKRERPPDGVDGGTGHDAAQAVPDSNSHAAAAAADGEAADAAETSRAAKQRKLEAAAAADGGSGGGAAAASTSVAGEAAVGSAADGAAAAAAAAGPPALSAAEKAAARLAKVIAADPMLYKEREVPPELPADVLQKALEDALQYDDDQQPYDDQQQYEDQQQYDDQHACEDQQQHEEQQQHDDPHQYEEEF